MRIITGSARGTKLLTLEGEATRPTGERAKEALFSMIQFEIEEKRVLDLYAGSGQLGLEALSRGAAFCMFVDSNPEAVEIIKKNAEKTKLKDRTRVIASDACNYVRKCAGGEKYHIVMIDPPYASGLVCPTLERLLLSDLLAPGALVFCESDREDLFADRPDLLETLTLRRYSSYGRIKLYLLEKKTEETE
ncbi:MAG: 16S rRNA (guanine(966)-N(2))-methyltransferase RsmD [Clostridia bacterium]|nr:16S rRNA (guanine(966)-N(2))-methyltransferase RsmD [Clostridia bacterium]